MRVATSIKDLKDLSVYRLGISIDMQVLKDLKSMRLDIYSHAEPNGSF